jgi:uncharacterized membrane protein
MALCGRLLFAIHGTLVLAGLCGSPALAGTYCLTDLAPAPGDDFSFAFGVNDAGQVAGGTQGATVNAAVWKNGTTPTVLPSVPGTNSGGTAYAINNSGQVVGVSYYDSNGDSIATAWNGTTGYVT